MWILAVNDALNLLVEDKVKGIVSMLPCLCIQVPAVAMAQPQGHFGYQIIQIIKLPPLVLDRMELFTELCVMSCHVLLKSFTRHYLRHMTQVHERSWSDSSRSVNS